MKFQKLLIMVTLWLAVIQPFFAERPADWHESTKIKSILTLRGDQAELPRGLPHCVAYSESRFIPTAKSELVDNFRSVGLMQQYRKYIVYEVGTYSDIKWEDYRWDNPDHSAIVGCNQLAANIKLFHGSVYLGVLSYTWGVDNVKNMKSIKDIPPRCLRYTEQILSLLDQWDESW